METNKYENPYISENLKIWSPTRKLTTTKNIIPKMFFELLHLRSYKVQRNGTKTYRLAWYLLLNIQAVRRLAGLTEKNNNIALSWNLHGNYISKEVAFPKRIY